MANLIPSKKVHSTILFMGEEFDSAEYREITLIGKYEGEAFHESLVCTEEGWVMEGGGATAGEVLNDMDAGLLRVTEMHTDLTMNEEA